jgi:hypothetical protein
MPILMNTRGQLEIENVLLFQLLVAAIVVSPFGALALLALAWQEEHPLISR